MKANGTIHITTTHILKSKNKASRNFILSNFISYSLIFFFDEIKIE